MVYIRDASLISYIIDLPLEKKECTIVDIMSLQHKINIPHDLFAGGDIWRSNNDWKAMHIKGSFSSSNTCLIFLILIYLVVKIWCTVLL
jgi:hypothetical protein